VGVVADGDNSHITLHCIKSSIAQWDYT
jgi:hypothetical protein